MSTVSKQPWTEEQKAVVLQIREHYTRQRDTYARTVKNCTELEAAWSKVHEKERSCHDQYHTLGAKGWYLPGHWGVQFGKRGIRPDKKLTPEACDFTISERDVDLEVVKGWYSDRKHKLLASYRKSKREDFALFKETKLLLMPPKKRRRHAQNSPRTSSVV